MSGGFGQYQQQQDPQQSYGGYHQQQQQQPFGGGGGFMPSPTKGRGNASVDSPSGGARKANSNSTLRSVTIQQLSEATQPHPDADFQLFGQDLHQVSIVGRVFNMAEQSTNIVYTLEDGTGSIDSRLWLDAAKDSDYQAQKRALIRDGSYVRLVGSLRSFNNKRTLQAYHVRLVTDFNEVTYHALDALHGFLRATKVDGSAGVRKLHFGNHAPTMPSGGTQGLQSDYMPHHMQQQPQQNFGGYAGADINPTQGRILALARELGQSNQGVNVSFLCQQLAREGFQESVVRDQIEHLIAEGQMYSTIDDEHCKVIHE